MESRCNRSAIFCSLFHWAGSAKNPALGNSLVLGAQLIVATQFVVEEKFLGQYNVPAMQAVGLEGLAGVSILAVVLPLMQFVRMSCSQRCACGPPGFG
jgi:hypothetical protein